MMYRLSTCIRFTTDRMQVGGRYIVESLPGVHIQDSLTVRANGWPNLYVPQHAVCCIRIYSASPHLRPRLKMNRLVNINLLVLSQLI